MSKKYLLISIGIIVIVIFSICIKCGKNDLPTTSMMDAERILQEYLKSGKRQILRLPLNLTPLL